MTDKNLLYAHVLLDRSGSMMAIRQQTIDAVNEYVSGLAADPDLDAVVSLTLFDDPSFGRVMDLVSVFDGIPVGEVESLTIGTYAPRGMTPLNDAIGQTVALMRSQYHRPNEKIALVIVTDGLENASREYTAPQVKALIESVQAEGWLVVYLGANQDSFAEGTAARGVRGQSVMNFAPTHIKDAMGATLRSTRMYASGANASDYGFQDAERLQAEGKSPEA